MRKYASRSRPVPVEIYMYYMYLPQLHSNTHYDPELLNTFSITILSLALLISARTKNKPVTFVYTCEHPKCDGDGVSRWLLQACQGIGGSNLTEVYFLNDEHGQFIGKSTICVCAHGQTKNHNYNISGPYPPGTATLRMDVTEKKTCGRKSCCYYHDNHKGWG